MEPAAPKRPAAAPACNLCRVWRVRCGGGQPCALCSRRGEACVYVPPKKAGRPKRSPLPPQPLPPPAVSLSLPSPPLQPPPLQPPPLQPPPRKRARKASLTLTDRLVAPEDLVAIEALSSLNGRSRDHSDSRSIGGSIGSAARWIGDSVIGALGAARDAISAAASSAMTSAATGAMGVLLSAGASALDYLPNLDESGLAPRWHGGSVARAAMLTALSAAERELLAAYFDSYHMIIIVVEPEALFAGLENMQAVGLLPWHGVRAAAARAAIDAAHAAAKGGSGSSSGGGSVAGGSGSSSGSRSGDGSGGDSSGSGAASSGAATAALSLLSDPTAHMRREGAESRCTAACYFAVLALAAQRRGWDVASRACVDASFEASAGVLLHSSQHMVSALVLLATLAFCAGDVVQANRLTVTALSITEPDYMSPIVLAVAHRFAAIFSRAPLPPTPPLLAPPGAPLAVAARAVGELHGWVYRLVLANIDPKIDEETWIALVMSIAAAWKQINDVCDTGYRDSPSFMLVDYTILGVALRTGNVARALAPARRLADFIAISLRVGACIDDFCFLALLGRALPVMRAAGETRVADIFAAALRSSTFSRALFQSSLEEGGVIRDLPAEAAAAAAARG